MARGNITLQNALALLVLAEEGLVFEFGGACGGFGGEEAVAAVEECSAEEHLLEVGGGWAGQEFESAWGSARGEH